MLNLSGSARSAAEAFYASIEGLTVKIEHGEDWAGIGPESLVTVKGTDRELEVFFSESAAEGVWVDAYLILPNWSGGERVKRVQPDYIEWQVGLMKARALAQG